MSVKLVEGFDHLQYTSLPVKGWVQTISGVGAVAGTLQAGRITGNCVRLTGPGNNGTNTNLFKALPATYATVVAGCAIRFNAVPFLASNLQCFALVTSGAALICYVGITTGNKLVICNSAGTVLATGPTTIAVGSWYYIELKAFVNGASGTVELRLGGLSEIPQTTVNIGSTNIGGISIWARKEGSTTPSIDYDDIYVLDTSGPAPNNNFLGECTVETKMPSGDGTSQDWVPSTGTAHWSTVDEQSGTFPNDDVDYVQTPNLNMVDTYTVPPLVISGGNVFAVQTNVYARKDDVGSRNISDAVRHAGTVYPGSTLALTSTYALKSQIRETDPTGSAWTVASVNAAEYGHKVV